MALSAGRSAFSSSNATPLEHSTRSDVSSSLQQSMSRDDEEATFTEHDYIGMSEADASAGSKTLPLGSGMRRSQGAIPDLNLGETELRLGPPKAHAALSGSCCPPSRNSSYYVAGNETFSNAPDGERLNFTTCSEQISCRGEVLVSGVRDGTAADRPQIPLKRGFSEMICSGFSEQSSSEAQTIPADVFLGCSATDSETKHFRNCYLPPAYPWAAATSSSSIDMDQSIAATQPFSSAIYFSDQQHKTKPSGDGRLKDSDPKQRDICVKRMTSEGSFGEKSAAEIQYGHGVPGQDGDDAPASCSPVVGWPPVQSYRHKALAAQPPSKPSHESQALPPAVIPLTTVANTSLEPFFVKAYMDGITIGRKVDLNSSNSYEKLSLVLEGMFRRFMLGNGRVQATLTGSTALLKEKKERSFLYGSEYVVTYEDKDGDLMLVGDVPWSMFIGVVRRLRIMKGSEAIGLAPKACETGKINTKHWISSGS